MTVSIYLCGGIRKDENDRKIIWSDEDKETINRFLGDVEILDPKRNPERYDPFAAFGCDLNDIKHADIIMVDCRQKRGMGIGAEMVIAKMLGKPVVTVAPRNSHYRRDKLDHFGKEICDWKHPFMIGLSDMVADTVEEAAEWVREFSEKPGKVKDGSVVEEAIEYYLDKSDGRVACAREGGGAEAEVIDDPLVPARRGEK